jgi:esterase
MSIDFSVRGEGEPLILIHGLFGTRENLGTLARTFAEDYCVYSIDLPNHGRSAHIDPFSLSTLATLVIEWMESIDLASARFFGHSLGGKVAMEIALSHPEKVKQLVVADIAPVRYQDRHSSVFEGLLAVDLDGLSSRTEAERVLSNYVTEKPVRSFLLKNLQRNDEGQFYWRMNLKGLHGNFAYMINQNREGVYSGPVLFLKAENSDYILSEHKDAITTRFPQTQLKVVSNTGHWLHAEKPDLVTRLSKRFFQ